MPRYVIVFKTQPELWRPKQARKVSGLSRNARTGLEPGLHRWKASGLASATASSKFLKGDIVSFIQRITLTINRRQNKIYINIVFSFLAIVFQVSHSCLQLRKAGRLIKRKGATKHIPASVH